uniref:Peptidase C-terminal archaeal/bacterial domain-containing protein n=1 Tax=uncultured bacterium A1Q1_fos_479 TaxID=1256575 RepID=L7W140_9BACT|nr:hypothetical protein [uncultured bacterium A1Q1_fos_479]
MNVDLFRETGRLAMNCAGAIAACVGLTLAVSPGCGSNSSPADPSPTAAAAPHVAMPGPSTPLPPGSQAVPPAQTERIAGAGGDHCSGAKRLELPYQGTDTLAGASDTSHEHVAATGYTWNGPERFYSFQALAGESFTVGMDDGGRFDGGVYIARSCDALAASTIAGADVSAGHPTMSFTVEHAGTYIIVVDSYEPNSTGEYSLNVARGMTPSATAVAAAWAVPEAPSATAAGDGEPCDNYVACVCGLSEGIARQSGGGGVQAARAQCDAARGMLRGSAARQMCAQANAAYRDMLRDMRPLYEMQGIEIPDECGRM